MALNQQIISVEEGVTIVVKAHGNLDLHGWERPEVGIFTDINVQKIRHENKLLRLLFVEDCDLSIPAGARIIIERISDNARVRDLANSLIINKVLGNLSVQNVDSLSIDKVSDDCLLENVRGDIKIARIDGDLKGKNLLSAINAEKVAGNIKLLGLGGNVDLRSQGSIEISLLPGNQSKIQLKASDNLNLHLPAEADATIHINSHGEQIHLDVAEYHRKVNEDRCEFVLGSGNQKIFLEAGNKVRVTGEQFDEKEIIKLSAELDKLWAHLKEEGETRRNQRAGEVHWEIRMVEGAAKIAEEAMVGVSLVTGQIAEDAARQAEYHVQAALKRVEEQIRRLGYDMDVEEAPTQDKKKSSDVTTEERLVVMRMLQEQKISVEEADRLLELLENKDY